MSIANLSPLSAPAAITDALTSAAHETGVDFRYLLSTAQRESSLNPLAKSKTSSASGLFQFIDQTWLSTVKAHGPKHGLEGAAAAIEEGAGGQLRVADPARKQAILALREDPRISALMAGELAKDSRTELQQSLGRQVNSGELYLAHFLGPREAGRFLNSASADPSAPAATQFPEAAAANHSVFYGSGGARSFTQVQDFLTHADGQETQARQFAEASPKLAIPELKLPSLSELDGDVDTQTLTSGSEAFSIAASLGTLRLSPQILQMLASLDAPGEQSGKDKGLGNLLSRPDLSDI